MLKYDYQYDLAAILITVVLFIVFQTRRAYATKANNTFMFVILCDLVAAIFDAISCYTITYPEQVPLAVNYIVSLGYLLFFNMMSVMYFMYIDSKAKITKNKRPAQIAAIISTTYYLVVILSSPWTKWVAYFSPSGEYLHGPLMATLYVIPFTMFIWEIAIFMIARRRFNKYQVVTSIAMIVGMGGSVMVQMIFERALIGTLVMAIIMIFAYLAYENPAYYTYEDTQCMNRHSFYEMLKKNAWKKDSISLLAFTIADFEYYHHSLGEHQLEQLSTRIADFLYQQFKRNAFCLSEDKYVVVLPHADCLEEYEKRIRAFIDTPISLSRRDVLINVHVCALKDLDRRFTADEVEAIVEYSLNNPQANLEAYEDIQQIIGNRVHRDMILRSIRRAIENDEFQVFYQPIYSTETKRFDSAEALIRLNDPELGFINPEELITLAEETGYIEQIGEIVFRKVCKFMKENAIHKYNVEYIEVNLSALQCVQENLTEIYAGIMEEYGIAPSAINLEITETAQTTKNANLMDNMQKLNAIGVEFSIDDYGSGFASANYLIELPVIIVKIDKSILWPAMKDARAMIVLKNTIKLLKELGKHIVVEGVETEEMVNILTECGCDSLQGYYFSKPVPPEQYLEFLRQRNFQ